MKFPAHGAALASTLVGLASAQVQGLSEPAVSISHDDSNKALETPAQQVAPTPEEVEIGPALQVSPPAEKPEIGRIERAIEGNTRVESLLTQPMVAFEGHEAIVRGRGFKASASAEQFVYSPIVGTAPDSSVRLSLRSVARGDDALRLSRNPDLRDVEGRLEVDRGSVVEAYAYDLESVEQLFRFDELPGSGDLVVTMDVNTSLTMQGGPNGIVFSNEHAQVNYSNAFVYDAEGVRVPIDTTWDDRSISLTVPASYLAGATLPVTIDPVLNSFVFGGGVVDDSEPDLAFDRDEDRYLIVFQDFASASDTDLYYFAVNGAGTVIDASFSSLAIGFDTAYTRPAVAVNDAANQFLVVAAGLPSGATNRQIDGFLIDVTPGTATGYTDGSAFTISDNPGGFDCFNADVAGNTFGAVNAFGYLVTWTRTFFATDNDVHGRIVATDGTLTTGRINIENSGANNDVQCSVSSSLGDSTTSGNYYNVVWIRDASGDGRGEVWARRVYFDGSFDGPFPTAPFEVNGFTNCVNPVTTSASEVDLRLTGDRYFYVAYPRVFGVGSGLQSSIYSSITTFQDVAGPNNSITAMEDFDVPEDQIECAIATDGQDFMLVYAERFNGNDNDYDQYMVSGGVLDAPGNGFTTTLSERHQLMGGSFATERGAAIASQYDGNERGTGFEDDACAVWTEGGDPSSSAIEGVTLDLLNNLPSFNDRPIGTQYCQAALNNSGRKGWIRAMAPDQSIGGTKRFVAIDLTVDAFGYLLASRNSGFVPNPAGSAGNLCVLGAGRYVNALANSGPDGIITTSVDPSNVPQPTGFVSIAPGETWFFQLWSRDIQSGSATSNFTNGVRVTFTN
ncbi:MAG: hypothetical protein AAGB93_12330 [Planctomycetota bacterium]